MEICRLTGFYAADSAGLRAQFPRGAWLIPCDSAESRAENNTAALQVPPFPGFVEQRRFRAVGYLHLAASFVDCWFPEFFVHPQFSVRYRRVFVVKLRLRDNESVNEAVRRFRKLVEHAGVKKEMRKREFYENPSDIRRRDRRRAEMRARRANQPPELDMQ